MAVHRIAIATSLIAALVAVAGCVSTHGNLERSADRLEHNAYALGRDSREANYGSYSRYSQDAQELADDTHTLREVLSDRSADDRDVKAAFERVSHSYHALRDGVERSDTHEAQVDLRPVTEAYLDVEREMGGYDGHRYARSGDRPRDRY